MPTITLKGIPDALYERLKGQAASNRRSLNSEVLVCLERAVAAQPPDAHAILTRMRDMRATMKLPYVVDDELQAAKANGRE